MAVVYTKYRFIDRMSASYLILSNLTLKNKLYKYIYIRIVQYYQPYTSDHDDFNVLIWLAASLLITSGQIPAG